MLLSEQEARDWIKANLTYFKATEFECSCCNRIKIDTQLLVTLDAMRSKWGSAIDINSGYRCPKHNSDIKGARYSPHMLGQAVDIDCTDSKFRFFLINNLPKLGIRRIGVDHDFVHADTASTDKHVPDILWLYP